MTAWRYRKPATLAGLGDRHAVVEASAGTGKTYLLEHLVVDLLLTRGLELEQILVVTFTEKATADLTDRIRRKLEELAALTADHPDAAGAPAEACWHIDDTARQRLRAALFAFDRASISTIHAFCQRLLGEHAFLNQRLFEEETIDEEQAFEGAFAETLRNDVATDPRLAPYVQLWLAGGKDLAQVKRAVLAGQRKLACLYPPRSQALRPELDEQRMLAAGRAFLACWSPALAAALKRDGVHHATVGAVMRKLETLTRATQPSIEAGNALALVEAMALLEWDRFFSTLDDSMEKSAASPALAPVARAIGDFVGATSLLGLLVAGIQPALGRRLERRKREAGLYDFQDMLTLVARSLDGAGEVAQTLLANLRDRYRHALIDEFQDTDEVQWRIFRRIFFESPDGHRLTVIGDPKQAIYAFRGADVHTYLAAQSQVDGAGGARVHLVDNFRSTAPLIQAYNAVLDDAAPFFRREGGIHYDHPVRCGRPELALVDANAGGAPAPALVVLDVESQLSSLLTYQVKKALLARMAQEIRGLLSPASGLRFGPAGQGLPLRAGDIYVLTRTTRESREVGDMLRAARLPFAYFKQEKLFGTIEAREVLDLLRAIADPDDPTARARAFITPFFGLGLVDLAACDELDASSGLLRTLYEWRGLAESGDFETLFARIVESSGVVSRELFFRASERSLTNYLHLLEILQEEAARTRATIRELAQTLGSYIAGTRRPPGEARDIQRLETDAEAVQIMTIHHAKGLEAPVVFLYGGLWPPPNNDVRAFHQGSDRVVRVGRQPADEQQLYTAEQDDEERRVLYVALTRAKARLYLPRFPPAFDKLKGCYQHINRRLDELLDGFTPAEVKALFHRVRFPAPAAATPALVDAPAAELARWQPPAALLAPDAPDDPRVAQAAVRAGFVITSYSAVKSRHGGFVAAAEEADDPVAGEGETPESAAPLPEEELPRGRLTGRFLHEVLEELPWDSLAGRPPLPRWAREPEIEALFERKRRRHDRRPEHVPHAQRLIHTALTVPLSLGAHQIAGLDAVDRQLREMEFLYPIPERAHPLLARELDPSGALADGQDGHPFRIERGLVKGYIDLLFEHGGRTFVCDWKGDWLPRWQPAAVAEHCARNYHIQAQLYALAALRLLAIEDRAGYEQRFGGVLYCFLRGMSHDLPGAGVYFHRPDWDEVLGWQDQMLSDRFWRLA